MTNLRYAWRSLRKSPGFVSIAVLALGVGLGLSTTMFAVLDTVLHPAVAYMEPDRLLGISTRLPRHSGGMTSADVYRYIRDNAHSFAGVAPSSFINGTIERPGDDPVEVYGHAVSPRWFAVAGIRPWRGRLLTETDGDDAVMVSRDLWTLLFHGRRSLEGATIRFGGRTVAVVGIVPDGAGWASIYRALPPTVETSGATSYISILARLRPGVTRERAEAETKEMSDRLSARFDTRDSPFALNVSTMDTRHEDVKDIHKAMLGAALVVLLIACVNLAHLMLTRGISKRRELALRMAVGASRSMVVRQMFTECALITVAGLATGIVIALWGVNLLRNQMPPEVGWIGLVKPELSWRVFALAGLAAAVSAIGFGLIPAIRVASAVSLDEPLKDDAGTTTGRVRTRYNPLVITEVALALVLLMGGALLLRTVHQLSAEREDANEETLYQGYVYVRHDSTSTGKNGFTRAELLDLISHTPGVRALALSSSRILRGGALTPEMTQDSVHVINALNYEVVSPDYLRVRALPIISGRDFEPGDAAGTGVAIVDAFAAKRLYPGENAVGHMLKLGAPQATDAPWVRIVGVSRSPVALDEIGRYIPQPQVWVSMADTTTIAHFILRLASPDPKLAATVQRRLRALPGAGVSLMAWNFARKAEITSRAFLADVFVSMGAVALGLSALGLYGVLAYAVTRRMREFAVRVALGAEPALLKRMVLRDGFVMILGGIAVGAFMALAASRWLDSVLIAILPSDVVSLVISEVILFSAGLAAALEPARRASRANPMDILRAT